MRASFLGSLLAFALLLFPAPGDAASTCPYLIAFDPAVGASTADTGWTGLAHNRPIFGNVLRLGVDCAADTPPCGSCPVTGLLPDAEGMFQRCLNDTSITCTEATEVDDCGAVDTCTVFLTVPQSTAVGGISSCYTNELTSAVDGSVDVESGALEVSLSYRSRIYFGETILRACPRCVGDPVANDGARDGTCGEGPRAGLICDGHGPSLPPYDADFGTSSFDCPPNSAALAATVASGPVTLSTGTQSRVLSPANPGCSGAPGLECFCDTCNNDTAEPCDENADCPDPAGPIGPICGGRRCIDGPNHGTPCTNVSECPGGACKTAGEPTEPTNCLDDTNTPETGCSDTAPVGDGKGRCADGPLVSFCSNHPNRGCALDSDCDGVPGACSSDNFPCFVTTGTVGDVLSVTGTATPPVAELSDPTALGMLTCLPATESNSVNNVVGFPGLTRNVHEGRLAFGGNADPAPTCPLAPAACRAPVVSGKSKVHLKDGSPDTKDQLRWRWSKGAATTLAELGEPRTTDHYELCVYDGTGLRASMVIPAGGLCGGVPCWKATTKGFVYKNKIATPRGITKLAIKSGDAGKTSIQVDGRGGLLPMPTLQSLQAPLQVQLRHRTSGLCWGARYEAPFKRFTETDLRATD